ncbi:MAG: hypothetical protein JRJ59_12720 [Deltaproteobacteria bacterium]|nr:hypothetical protein [Deltaproteobacteria bacterium]
MTDKQVTVCFIDDSPFERSLFEEVFGATPGWRLVIAETFAAAQDSLGTAIPLLWLLDLWGNDPQGPGNSEILSPQEVQRAAEGIPGLETVWAGLDEFPGDKINEFLKRLYTVVLGWQELFLRAAQAADQTRAYGLYNLAQVRAHYPGTAALAYTRKSQSQDLTAFLAAGGDGAFLKPHGPDDQAILARTKAQAPALVRQMTEILNRRLAESLLGSSLTLLGSEGGYLYSLAGALLRRSPPPKPQLANLDPYLARYVEEILIWLEVRPNP